MTIKGKHPIRKCPFLRPLIGGKGNSMVHLYQDCMRNYIKYGMEKTAVYTMKEDEAR